MAQIRYSCIDFYRYHSEPSDEVLPVAAPSVREQIMQQCLRRFYEKHSSIGHYTDNKAQFVASSTCDDEPGEKLSGLISCEALKQKLQSSAARQILESADLTQEEMSLLLETCDDTSAKSVSAQETKVSHQESGANPALLQSLLEKLSRNNVTEHNSQPEQFKDVLVFESKREFEAAVRDGIVDRELHCQRRTAGQTFTGNAYVRVMSKKRPAVHPDHPLNHLADMDSQLFPKKKKHFKTHKNYSGETTSDLEDVLNKICTSPTGAEDNPTELCLPSTSDTVFCDLGRTAKSQWDVRESKTVLSLHQPKPTKESGISAEQKKIDFSKEFILLPKDDDLLPIPLIKEHCVLLDKLLEMFPQYTRGTPSKTLYVKNLHKHATPNDLVSLFGHFDKEHERVTYRLLTGRMRGQAFIKFPNVSAATSALETCIGFKLMGKPLVIEYGKHN